ncbi:MAG: ParM/StbA family protein [Firmicutes bacterium]|nr:ParM/StbA family protein [Bacillota bacterium]
MINLGIDIGFGFVKATNGQKQVIFPSVVGEGRNIRYSTGINDTNIIDNLTLQLKGNDYFVGSLANRQSDIVMSTLSQNRVNSIENEILLCTALGLLDPPTEVNIVTGLPVNEYSDRFKVKLLETLRGYHQFSLNGSSNDIKVNNCKVIPQPFGTIFDQLLDGQGKILNPDYANITLGIIDIGFRTSDFAVADNLEYVDKMSSSSNIALSSAFKLIARELNAEYGITKPLYQLDQAIRKEQITINGREIDLSPLKEKAFQLTAQNIISEVSTLWNIWEIETILIAGGGGIALYDYLPDQLDNIMLVRAGQFSNVQGYLKMANRNW